MGRGWGVGASGTSGVDAVASGRWAHHWESEVGWGAGEGGMSGSVGGVAAGRGGGGGGGEGGSPKSAVRGQAANSGRAVAKDDMCTGENLQQ